RPAPGLVEPGDDGVVAERARHDHGRIFGVAEAGEFRLRLLLRQRPLLLPRARLLRRGRARLGSATNPLLPRPTGAPPPSAGFSEIEITCVDAARNVSMFFRIAPLLSAMASSPRSKITGSRPPFTTTSINATLSDRNARSRSKGGSLPKAMASP